MATVSLPYTLTNGATADASQVMANFNALVAALNGGLDSTNVSAALAALLHSPGDVKASARATPETGWLPCDGSAVSRTTYAALFTAIGTAYGAGDGSTTFNVPDMRGRMPVGLATGGDSTVDALGDSDGIAMAGRHPRHAHTVPDHAHTMAHTHTFGTGASTANYAGGGSVTAGLSVATNAHGHNGTTDASSAASTGTQTAFQTQDSNPSFLTVNFFVKT